MATKRSFLRHLHLPVLVFVGVGAAVVGVIYGFPVGLLVLGYYYIGLHVSQLADRRSSDEAEARSETAVGICDPATPGLVANAKPPQRSSQGPLNAKGKEARGRRLSVGRGQSV